MDGQFIVVPGRGARGSSSGSGGPLSARTDESPAQFTDRISRTISEVSG
ncbi:hypothetical protein [Luteococcus sanguinis]|uniref:Uncharacterized protein n=1 Tax=Luteococcus sanguinis TaxID=174038 RepID=A0ABW1X7T0_9ACTN